MDLRAMGGHDPISDDESDFDRACFIAPLDGARLDPVYEQEMLTVAHDRLQANPLPGFAVEQLDAADEATSAIIASARWMTALTALHLLPALDLQIVNAAAGNTPRLDVLADRLADYLDHLHAAAAVLML